MTRLYFQQALIEDGWRENVRIDIDDAGTITAIEANTEPEASDHWAKIAVPGIPNVHSHAFQRAMAGMAETRANGDDSFWTWRAVMYKFLERLTPSDLFAIAAQAYSEMLESGFTAVCEFHYLHHDPAGRPYSDPGAMTVAVAEAAELTGIGPTLLPVFYAQGGFGGAAPTDSQRRFVTSPDQYARLLERTRAIAKALPDAQVGIAPHSLRAVTEDSLTRVVGLLPDGPIHIHIAEQTREVEDCLAWSGRRPVQWLTGQHQVDHRWCLVHATHLTPEERQTLAGSGAVAGLCPITEANLGDGIFDATGYEADGGMLAIGSDSNVLINAAEELRLLEYSQRFRDRQRNCLAGDGVSSGRRLFDLARSGGARAAGRKTGALAVGYRGDIVSLDHDHPALLTGWRDGWLDGWIFAANRPVVSDVWVGGRHVVKDGRHVNRARIRRQYATTMEHLMS